MAWPAAALAQAQGWTEGQVGAAQGEVEGQCINAVLHFCLLIFIEKEEPHFYDA